MKSQAALADVLSVVWLTPQMDRLFVESARGRRKFLDRLVFGHPLADRPALLLSSLLVVLGMQLFALGLLGELIIFTHARDIRDYQIEEVVRYPAQTLPEEPRVVEKVS